MEFCKSSLFVCSEIERRAVSPSARLHLEAAHPRSRSVLAGCIHAAHVAEMAPRADPKAALLSRYASDGYQPPAAASNRIDDDDLLFAARKQVRHSGVARGLRTLPSESTTDDVKTGSRRDRLATTAPSQRPSSSMVQWKRAAAMVRATYSLPAPSNGLPRRLGGAPSKASQRKGTSAAGKLVDVSASSPYATALNKMASPEYTSRYTDPKSIWAALQTEDVQLVSLKWLLERGAKKKPLPRRQALPPEAKMSHKRLAEIHARSKAFERIATARQVQAQVMPIIAVSHAWLTVTHPDPHADNLVTICKALKTAFWDHKMEKCFEDVGVFLDWCSLYQEHGGTAGRTPEQQSSFKRALNSTMDLWYSVRRGSPPPPGVSFDCPAPLRSTACTPLMPPYASSDSHAFVWRSTAPNDLHALCNGSTCGVSGRGDALLGSWVA